MALRWNITEAVRVLFVLHHSFRSSSGLVRYHDINIVIHTALRDDQLLGSKLLLRIILYFHAQVPFATNRTPTGSLTSNAINKAIHFIRG